MLTSRGTEAAGRIDPHRAAAKAMTHFYTIKPYCDKFRVQCDGKWSSHHTHDTVQAAKLAVGAHAVRVYGDGEVAWDYRSPLHRAISSLETLHNPNTTVTAVGRRTYLIRRSTWGVDVPIVYRVVDGKVRARNLVVTI